MHSTILAFVSGRGLRLSCSRLRQASDAYQTFELVEKGVNERAVVVGAGGTALIRLQRGRFVRHSAPAGRHGSGREASSTSLNRKWVGSPNKESRKP